MPATARLLTPEELAELLAVSIDTVYRWNSSGEGPRYFKCGRHCRYAEKDVDEWLNARASRPSPA